MKFVELYCFSLCYEFDFGDTCKEIVLVKLLEDKLCELKVSDKVVQLNHRLF